MFIFFFENFTAFPTKLRIPYVNSADLFIEILFFEFSRFKFKFFSVMVSKDLVISKSNPEA